MTKYAILLLSILVGSCHSEEQSDTDTKAKVKELNAVAKKYGFTIDPGSENLRESILDTMSLEEAKQMLLDMKNHVDEMQRNNPDWVDDLGRELRNAKTQEEKDKVMGEYKDKIQP